MTKYPPDSRRTGTEKHFGASKLANASEAADITNNKAVLTPKQMYDNVATLVPDATTSVKGKVELATDTETKALTDTVRAVTPSNLGALNATETQEGLGEIATDAEAIAASVSTNKFLVPSNLAAITATNLAALSASDSDAQTKTSVAVYVTPANLAASGFLQWADVTITSAQVLLLATTPISLVAAPAAGSAHSFISASFKLNYGGTNAFTEAGDNLVIKYTDASGVAVSEIVECTGFIDATADTLTNCIPVKDNIVVATGAEAQALVLDNNNANFAGNAAGDNTLTIRTYYVTQAI